MRSIIPFFKPSDGLFDDHATRVMGEAYDAASKQIDPASHIVHEAIAARIIAAAHKGERDPVLCEMPGWPASDTKAKRSRPPQLAASFVSGSFVSEIDSERMAGAANSTIGSIAPHEISHDKSQWDKKWP